MMQIPLSHENIFLQILLYKEPLAETKKLLNYFDQ